MTYNIHRAIGVDRRFRPGRIFEVIEHHRPDVLLLTFAHPTLAEQDLRLDLYRAGDVWRGSLPAAPSNRRYIQLEPPSGEWRLAAELADGQRRLELGAAQATQ